MKKQFLILLFFPLLLFSQNKNDFEKGLSYSKISELDSAIYYFENHLKTQQYLISKESEALTYSHLAKAYKLKGNYVVALSNYKKAEAIYLDLKNYDLLTNIYVVIAEFYRFKYDFISSENYLNLAKEVMDNNDVSDRNIAYYLNRKAAVYIEKDNDFLKSIACSEQVLEIAKKIDDQSLIASSLNEIGYAYENLNNPVAEKYYNESLKKFYELDDKLSQANLLNNLARLYNKQGRILEAKKHIDKGYEVAIESGYKRDLMEFSHLYAIYYEKEGSYKEAYKYLEDYRALEKEELISKWDKRVIEVERKYELEKKNKELEKNNITLKSQSNDLKTSKGRFLIASVLILILLLFVFIIIYFLRKSKKDNSALKNLSDQNKFLLSEANHRINNNLQIIILLISDQLKKVSKEQQTEIKNILTKIDSIATLHRHLYRNSDKTRISCDNYLNEILINFNAIFKENHIKLEYKIDPFLLPTDMAMYLGLLLTELCINSIKHAFENQSEKKIQFNLKHSGQQIDFQYVDNGLNNSNKEIKPKLIDKLCRQLKIEYSINTAKGFSFSFKKILK